MNHLFYSATREPANSIECFALSFVPFGWHEQWGGLHTIGVGAGYKFNIPMICIRLLLKIHNAINHRDKFYYSICLSSKKETGI